MLALGRKCGETIEIDGGKITVKLIAAAGGKATIGIDAPPEVDINRGEIGEIKRGFSRIEEVIQKAMHDSPAVKRHETAEVVAAQTEAIAESNGESPPPPKPESPREGGLSIDDQAIFGYYLRTGEGLFLQSPAAMAERYGNPVRYASEAFAHHPDDVPAAWVRPYLTAGPSPRRARFAVSIAFRDVGPSVVLFEDHDSAVEWAAAQAARLDPSGWKQSWKATDSEPEAIECFDLNACRAGEFLSVDEVESPREVEEAVGETVGDPEDDEVTA